MESQPAFPSNLQLRLCLRSGDIRHHSYSADIRLRENSASAVSKACHSDETWEFLFFIIYIFILVPASKPSFMLNLKPVGPGENLMLTSPILWHFQGAE